MMSQSAYTCNRNVYAADLSGKDGGKDSWRGEEDRVRQGEVGRKSPRFGAFTGVHNRGFKEEEVCVDVSN